MKKVGDSGFIWNRTFTKDNWSVVANGDTLTLRLGHHAIETVKIYR